MGPWMHHLPDACRAAAVQGRERIPDLPDGADLSKFEGLLSRPQRDLDWRGLKPWTLTLRLVQAERGLRASNMSMIHLSCACSLLAGHRSRVHLPGWIPTGGEGPGGQAPNAGAKRTDR